MNNTVIITVPPSTFCDSGAGGCTPMQMAQHFQQACLSKDINAYGPHRADTDRAPDNSKDESRISQLKTMFKPKLRQMLEEKRRVWFVDFHPYSDESFGTTRHFIRIVATFIQNREEEEVTSDSAIKKDVDIVDDALCGGAYASLIDPSQCDDEIILGLAFNHVMGTILNLSQKASL